jgi:DNA-binding CsgD family transcriptional regulator
VLPAHLGIATIDPAYPVIAGILDIVRVSTWRFARIEPNGRVRSAGESGMSATDVDTLVAERERQRTSALAGPRIAATLSTFPGYVSGITLLFADVRADYGIMTLLRDETLPPFSSVEVSLLTFALDAGSERFAALRLQPSSEAVKEPAVKPVPAPSLQDEAFYVLDHDFQIMLAWNSEHQRRIAVTGDGEQIAERLPPILEESVRDLTAGWAMSSVKEPGIARPVSFLVVRTQPMTGPAGLFVGVRIDRFRPPNALTGPAQRFHISPREVQVLALLLDGDHLDQISHRLNITSSTVQDHIRSMLEKTESRNRSELIARVLGWEAASNPRMG